MTYERLEGIFKTTESLSFEYRRFSFREGMMILFDLFEESDEIYAVHDQIFYGEINDVLEKITEEQAIKLAGLGWFLDEGSFSKWT